MCCPTKSAPIAPTYEVSVAVQPRIVIEASPAQPSPKSVSTSTAPSIASAAHARFASTDQVSVLEALRTPPKPKKP